MSNIHAGGWGAQSWGGSGWGGLSSSGNLSLLGILCPAENVARILLSTLPYYSQVFDPYDASDPAHYSVAPVVTTTGWDGYAARPVSVVQAVLSTQAQNAVDVYLDRPLSPYPAQYVVSFSNLATPNLAFVLAGGSAQVFGVYRKLQPQHEDVVLPTSDLANPQTVSAVQASGLGSTLGPTNTVLGVYQVDGTGDYGFEAGVQSVKKRILRRGVTNTGAFAHLPPGYGVGLMEACKRLSIPSVRNRMAANYQSQILQEPEVVSASVTAVQDPSAPAIIHFLISVKTNIGTTLSFDHPVDTITGISLAQMGS